MIPKIIHQVWIGDEIPEDYQESIESVKKHFSEWEYKLWLNDENRQFIKDNFKWFLDSYDKYEKDINRADAVRYFQLYKYGGMYVDMDIDVYENFDHLLLNSSCCLFPFIHRDYFKVKGWEVILSNCMMASIPGHEFFDKIILHLKSDIVYKMLNDKSDDLMEVFAKAGPIFLTRMYDMYRYIHTDIDILSIIDAEPNENTIVYHKSLCKWIEDK